MKELFVWFDFNVRIEIDEELEEKKVERQEPWRLKGEFPRVKGFKY